jgi:hypothetical protein
MRFLASAVLAVCTIAIFVTVGNTADEDPTSRQDPQAPIVFPEVLRRSAYAFLPLDEFAMDKQLVREVNGLKTKREQVRMARS